MATFSINQVSHLYVAKVQKSAESNYVSDTDLAKLQNVGDIMVGNPNGVAPDKVNLWFAYYGPGGVVRSDLIKPENILWMRKTAASAMADTMAQYTVSLASTINSGDPVVGQDYVLTFKIEQFLSPSNEDQYVAHAAARAFTGDTKTSILAKLGLSLAKSLDRLQKNIVTIKVGSVVINPKWSYEDLATNVTTGSSLIIIENEQPWVLGKIQYGRLNFTVTVGTITEPTANQEVQWGSAARSDSAVTVGNGKKIADLEYFTLGARGDIYRHMGYPYDHPSEVVIGTAGASKTYDVFQIHYSYIGDNQSCQKSEKDLILVAEAVESPTVSPLVGIESSIQAVLAAANVVKDIQGQIDDVNDDLDALEVRVKALEDEE